MTLKELFDRALRRAIPWRYEAPDVDRTGLEAAAAAVLEAFEESLEGKSTDREMYRQAIAELLDRARDEGRFALFSEQATEADLPECSCRCRAHGVLVCRKCLRTEACQLHVNPDVRELR